MNIKIEEKKIEAIKALEKLGIYTPYIEEFKRDNTICYFEGYAGFWAYQDEELMKKVKEIENKYNCMVYAITHEITSFGEIYDFLIITDYKEEWSDLVEKVDVWVYPNVRPISKKILRQIEDRITDYYARQGYQVSFVDLEDILE